MHSETYSNIACVDGNSVSCFDIERELTSHEKEMYAYVPKNKKYQWILGRGAVKHAVQLCMKEHNSERISRDHIEITSYTDAPPQCVILGRDVTEENHIRISISHSGNMAVGGTVFSNTGIQIGVDIEQIRAFTEEMVQNFLTENEYILYKRAQKEEQNLVLTRYWCLKEAYLKARGVGLRQHPKTVHCTVNNDGTACVYDQNIGLSKEAYWTIKQGSYIVASICL